MKSIINTIIAAMLIASASWLSVVHAAAAESPPAALRSAGLWRSGDGSKQVLVAGLPTDQFHAKRHEFARQGLAITSIAVYRWNGDDHYVAVFEPMPDSVDATVNPTILLSATWKEFAAKDKSMFDKGFRVADIALSIEPKNAHKVRYTAVWRKGLGTGIQWTDQAMPWEDFAKKAKERFDKGLRLVAMDAVAVLDPAHADGFRAVFTGTWRDGQGNGALYLIQPSNGVDYANLIKKRFDDGLRSVAFSTYTLDGHTPMYVGAVRGGLGTPGEWRPAAMKWEDFAKEHQKMVAQGFKLLDISAYTEFTKID